MNPRLRAHAHRQNGAFTLADALASGYHKQDVIREALLGDWVERHPEVFVSAAQPLDAPVEHRAALLAVGGEVALCAQSAGWVWRLPGIEPPQRPQLVVPGDRRYGHLKGVEVRRVEPDTWQIQTRRGWPVTPLDVTVRQLAAETGHMQLRALIQDLLIERRTTLDRLNAVRGRGLSGSAALNRAIRELDPAHHNFWERVLARALWRVGLRVQPQFLLRSSSGRTCYLDLGLPEICLGIEIDGFLSHVRKFAADRKRTRLICLELGWQLAPVAVSEIADDLDAVVAEILSYARRHLMIAG